MKRYIQADIVGLHDEDYETKIDLLRDKNVSPRLLTRLATDSNAAVRGAVAQHKNTPDDVRWELAHDPDPIVRCCVLNYQYTLPEKYFELLVEDPDTDVRDTVACRLDAPVDVLRKLLDDKNKHIRAMANETLNYVLRARGGN